MIRAALLFALCTTPAAADTLAAARVVRAQSIIVPEDLTWLSQDVPGALADPAEVVGKEARVMLYAGRPIRPGDVGPPALVERNQIVKVLFRNGPISIAIEGRALGRAAIGEEIRVMNLDSRTTVSGTVAADGSVIVSHALP
ncbi:flagellar basal body P-ring formation chaperone FlgA [Oceaniglobus roseus]|uniref:flagellar basal body P-ring formation chaperone FlgA n=1 Tax=Oceaniglobus roseus TaxID=1737570 RepID=UPI000C7EEAF2|nr:flagellar basal body P-ring formation chaperone FlgA [Kandeliimicrobium roseum]